MLAIPPLAIPLSLALSLATDRFVVVFMLVTVAAASVLVGWLIHDVKVGQRGLRNYSASYGRRFRKSFQHRFGPGPQAPPRPELAPPRSHVRLVGDQTGDTSGDYPPGPRAVRSNPELGKCICHGLVARSAYAGWVHVDPERDDHQAVYAGALGSRMPEGPEGPS